MRWPQVLWKRRVLPWVITSDMAGHSLAQVETFNGFLAQTNLHLFFDQLIRHTVIMAICFQVIVNIHQGFFPLAILIGCRRQTTQGRFFQAFEP